MTQAEATAIRTHIANAEESASRIQTMLGRFVDDLEQVESRLERLERHVGISPTEPSEEGVSL